MKTLTLIWTFIRDHIWLAILIAVFGFIFFFVPAFKEIAYGALRVLIGVLIVAIVLYAWFRETVRESIVTGTFVAKFKELEAKHHVAVVISVIALITWAVVESLVHP